MPNSPILRVGSRGEEVRALQEALNAQGARIDVDGIYGPQTAQAVAAFQQQAGLPVDGQAGPQTMGALAQSAQAPPVPQPNPQRTAQINPVPRQPMASTMAPVGPVTQGGPLPPPLGPVQGPIRMGAPQGPTQPGPAQGPVQMRAQGPVMPGPIQGPIQGGPVQGPVQMRAQGPIMPGPAQGPIPMGPAQGPVQMAAQGPVMPGPAQGPINQGPAQGPPQMRPMGPMPLGPIQGPIQQGPAQGPTMPGPVQGPIQMAAEALGPVHGATSDFDEYATNIDPAQLAQYEAEQGMRTEGNPNPFTVPRLPRPMPAGGPGQNAPIGPVAQGGPLPPVQPRQMQGIESLLADPSAPWPTPRPEISAPRPLMAGGVPRLPSNAILPEGGRSYPQPPPPAPMQRGAGQEGIPMGPPPGPAPPTNQNIPMVQNDLAGFMRRLMQMGLPPEAAQRLIAQLTAQV